MLRDIIRKEIMDNISTLKFVVTFVVVIVLVFSGLTLGSKNYLEQRGDLVRQLQLNQRMMASQSNWLSAGYIGIFESKRPYVLSAIDNGIDNSLGRQAQVNIDMETRLDESRNLVSPILAVFGDVDLTFVVKIILSLFVILLTYDAISGEKERGTLKLNLANDVPRHRILIGKILGGFISIIIPFLLPLLIGLAFVMTFFPDVLADFDAETWYRLLIIVGVYLLYLAVFFALGLFVSSLCHRSATSFIVLLMIWVLVVTIIPRLSVTAAERLRPYESYTTLQTRAFREISAQRRELMERFQDPQEWVRAMNEGRLAAYFAEIFSDQASLQQEIMDRYNRQYERQQSAQITLAETLSRSLSPTSAMSFAVQNLAGTGWARQEEYVRQLREFQDEFRDYVLGQVAQTEVRNFSTFQEDMFLNESLDVSMESINFEFREESLATVLDRSLWDIAVLVLLTIVFFTAAFLAFLRYDVR